MRLLAYADDSGTHSKTGELPGAREAVIAGIVAPEDEWAFFNSEWRAALKKYDAQYFHFCDWSEASAVVRKRRKRSSRFSKNPYHDWSQTKLDDFIAELSVIAGSGDKVIVGMGVSTNIFHVAQQTGVVPKEEDPYVECAKRFFPSVAKSIALQRSPWKRQHISFVFDRSEKAFSKSLEGVFTESKNQFVYFHELTFAQKTEQLPLQAADMVAYRCRQTSENWIDGGDRYWDPVDSALFQSLHAFVLQREEKYLAAYVKGELDYPPRIEN